MLGVTEIVGVTLGVTEIVGVTLGVTEIVGVIEGVTVGVTVFVGFGVGGIGDGTGEIPPPLPLLGLQHNSVRLKDSVILMNNFFLLGSIISPWLFFILNSPT